MGILNWTRQSSRGIRRRSTHCRPLSRPVRLHAERLEDRLLMTGNDPDDSAAVAVAIDVPAIDIDSFAVPTDKTSSQSASETDWARFGSAAELEAWLVEAARAEWGHLFGTRTPYPHGYVGWIDFDGIGLITPVRLTQAFASSTNDGTLQTNVQVEGVDEADLIETDGNYLYIIADKTLVIVEAGEGDNLRVVSRLALDGRPIGMYLSGDRLAIVSENGGWSDGEFSSGLVNFIWLGNYPPEKTTVTLLDIADKSSPKLVQKTEMDGRLVTSRVVDGQLRLVVDNTFKLPMPIARKVEGGATEPASKDGEVYPIPGVVGDALLMRMWYPYGSNGAYEYESEEEYIARVKAEILGSLLPKIRSLALDGTVIDESPLIEASELFHSGNRLDRSITTIATFDLTSNEAGPADTLSLINSGAAQVYATTEGLYLFSQRNWNFQVGIWAGDQIRNPQTHVWKFAFDGESHDIDLVAKGSFDGQVLNQFAADEHEGYLRVVTTDPNWGAGLGQSVLVFAQNGRKLEIVGRVDNIAPTETLYSVQFAGDRAYFVTFRTIDPLFVVDLSVPTNPQLKGELHIPGYSDHLQIIDENHLLAIGRDADEQTGLFEELQVSIFDVSDLENPVLVDRYSFAGGRSTATPVTGDRWARGDGDHHALGYYADEQIVALPIHTEDNWGWWQGQTEEEPIFEQGKGGLQLFKIGVETGFTSLGIIEHDTLVKRSVQIGDRLFAISSGTVSVHEMANPMNKLGEVEIGDDSGNDLVELTMFDPPVVVETMESSEPEEAHEVRKRSAPTEHSEPAERFETMLADPDLAAQPMDTPSLTAGDPSSPVVALQVGWAVPPLEHSRTAQPARAAALMSLCNTSRLDTEAINLLAVDGVEQRSSQNFRADDSHFVDDELKQEAHDGAWAYDGLQALVADAVFCPL